MQLLVQDGTNATVQITYTVQRHREILHEYQDEFRKTKVWCLYPNSLSLTLTLTRHSTGVD